MILSRWKFADTFDKKSGFQKQSLSWCSSRERIIDMTVTPDNENGQDHVEVYYQNALFAER